MFWDKIYQVQRRLIPTSVERQIMHILACFGGIFGVCDRTVFNTIRYSKLQYQRVNAVLGMDAWMHGCIIATY